jgi:hypothetical protein
MLKANLFSDYVTLFVHNSDLFIISKHEKYFLGHGALHIKYSYVVKRGED